MFLLEEFSKVGNPNFRISVFPDDWDDSRGAGCKCYCRDKVNKDFDNDSRLINQIYRVETLRFGECNVISKQ